MLCTLAQAKDILRKDDTTDDAELTTLLEYAQDDLVEYLNNAFQDRLITYEAGTIAFVNGAPDTITDSDEQFVIQGFTDVMDIAVEWAYGNSGIYELDTVAAGTLTLSTDNELVDMSPTDNDHPLSIVKISMVNWPKALRMVVAKMAWYLYTMDGARPEDKLSESRDGSSYQSSVTLMRGSYPSRILALANKWKRPRYV